MLRQKGFFKDDPDFSAATEYFSAYLDAFRELSSSRPSGLDLQAIPFTAMVEYFKIFPLGDFVEFHYLMRRMDDAFLRLHRNKASEQKSGSDGKSAANKNHPRNRRQ